MVNIDMEFFSGYKRLDNTLKDMYGTGGVSRYIELLEQNSGNPVILKNWEFYRQLKHLRGVRNQIAHSNESDSFTTDEDMESLERIYKSFLDRDDPMCLLKAEEERKLRRTDTRLYISKHRQSSSADDGKNNFLAFAAIFLFLIISFLVLISITS